jgi:hypothetical protein
VYVWCVCVCVRACACVCACLCVLFCLCRRVFSLCGLLPPLYSRAHLIPCAWRALSPCRLRVVVLRLVRADGCVRACMRACM